MSDGSNDDSDWEDNAKTFKLTESDDEADAESDGLKTSRTESDADEADAGIWNTPEKNPDARYSKTPSKTPNIKSRLDSPHSTGSPRSPRSPTTYGEGEEKKDIDQAPPLEGEKKISEEKLRRSTKSRQFELEKAQKEQKKQDAQKAGENTGKNTKKLRF